MTTPIADDNNGEKNINKNILFDLENSNSSDESGLKKEINSSFKKLIKTCEISKDDVSSETVSPLHVFPCSSVDSFPLFPSLLTSFPPSSYPWSVISSSQTSIPEETAPSLGIQHYRVRWSNHQLKLTSYVAAQEFEPCKTDVKIISKEGIHLFAHRLVIAATSPYLKRFLTESTMDETVAIILPIPWKYLRSILSYCYTGLLQADHTDIEGILLVAEQLQLAGFDSILQQYDNQKNNWTLLHQAFPTMVPDCPSTSVRNASIQDLPKEVPCSESMENVTCHPMNPPSTCNVNGSRVLLWRFLMELLHDSQFGYSIRWTDRNKGIFRILGSEHIAHLWGEKRKNQNMTYEKMSRGMRTYYKRGILSHLDGTKLIYRFNMENSEVKQQMKLYEMCGKGSVNIDQNTDED